MSNYLYNCPIQLNLNDVHIRYEDALTCPGRAFACGLAVEALTAESCDSSWRRGAVAAGEEPCSYKLLELANLALYWDPMPVPAGMMADCTITELTVGTIYFRRIGRVFCLSQRKSSNLLRSACVARGAEITAGWLDRALRARGYDASAATSL